MTPGIPGFGLGGLFFIISALLAPVFEIVRTARGRSSLARWRVVGYQAAIAASIVVATMAMLWLFELILLETFGVTQSTAGQTGNSGPAVTALERLPLAAAPVLITLLVLVFVLCLAEVLRLIFRRPRPGETRALEMRKVS